ncbi:hypothetical protein AAFX91_36940 [Bradyrhizobium sp. 31Argb]|uniref:hypothetical protein n=1 Tax=Bradyrhizobium sp. 31Argb TaxID=3141247 RepID=UPI00374A010F
MRPEHFHNTQLSVRVPRGHEGFWQIICQLAERQGDFTINDVDGESNVGRSDVQVYVWSLHKAGFLDMVSRGAPNHVSAVFRLVKRQKEAPRVRRDGSIIPSTAQEQLWRTIRNLKSFGLTELVFAATTEEVAPGYQTAKRYVCRLTTAGYLTEQRSRGAIKAVYRLKPGMDTGPKPPEARKLEAELMWDPNKRVLVGAAPIASEVSR